ncbi:hypothetical protein F4677DRAFT_408535 [Hypoxylon crocopeplum]|nr:hypothetical protein F4677DRAFT_408535 [Hypoxylon crocopeplum]
MNAVSESLLPVIAEQLDRKADVNTILKLRLVNRQFRRIFTPHVYLAGQNATAQELRDGLDSQALHLGPGHRCSEYLRYLCFQVAQEYHTSGFVKEVIPRAWKGIVWSVKSVQLGAEIAGDIVGGGGFDKYNKALANFHPLIPDSLRQLIYSGVMSSSGDACLAFALAVCRQLEVVKLPRVDMDGYGPYTRQVVLHARQQQEQLAPPPRGQNNILGALTEFCIVSDASEISLSDALDILSLNSLRHLRLGNFGQNLDYPDTILPHDAELRQLIDPNRRPRVNRPVDLTFEHCRLDAGALTRLLSGCSQIRSLYIEVWPARLEWADNEQDGLKAAAGKGMEFLFYDTSSCMAALDNAQSWRFLDILGSFDGLRSLAISRNSFANALDLAFALPPSLRELLIIGGVNTDLDFTPPEPVGVNNYAAADAESESSSDRSDLGQEELPHADSPARSNPSDDDGLPDLGPPPPPPGPSDAVALPFRQLVRHPMLPNLARVACLRFYRWGDLGEPVDDLLELIIEQRGLPPTSRLRRNCVVYE